jgi:dTDP-4-dehydrorhamnose reductase
MKILVTGADGNIGRRLQHELAARGHDVSGVDIGVLDITAYTPTINYVDNIQPDLIVHCAAMTNVDRCAEQPELALQVNGVGTQNVALAAQRVNAAICYLSTNEVFDGKKGSPYLEYDPTGPINPYGYSKWVGEQVVREATPRHIIVRTSWIFAHGGTNFLQKIVERAAGGGPLSVVVNEIGCPTYGDDFAQTLPLLLEMMRFGTYHLTNEGHTSRYEFARYILQAYGFGHVEVKRSINAQYPRPSRPPVYGALANMIAASQGIKLRPWREAVEAFVERERSLAAPSR